MRPASHREAGLTHGKATCSHRKDLEKVLKEELAAEGPSVLIFDGVAPVVDHVEPAVRAALPRFEKGLYNRQKNLQRKHLKAGCIALSFTAEGKTGYAEIDPLLCNGCGVCAQLCTSGSMKAGL